MAEVFEGDLAGAVFWGADLRGSLFRDVDLTNAKITHAWLVDVDIDALVDRVVINGVDVTAYVNERDPWYPLRSMLRASDPAGMRDAWAALEAEWAKTTARAETLAEDALYQSVGGEWSFVDTQRHLVYAMDKWISVPVFGGGFHPIGLTHQSATDVPPGLAPDTTPSIAEVRTVRVEQGARFREFLATLSPAELTRTVDVIENGPNPVRECIATVFEEEFWHNRYALRDLAVLATDTDRVGGPA
jgi:hypothetical protein